MDCAKFVHSTFMLLAVMCMVFDAVVATHVMLIHHLSLCFLRLSNSVSNEISAYNFSTFSSPQFSYLCTNRNPLADGQWEVLWMFCSFLFHSFVLVYLENIILETYPDWLSYGLILVSNCFKNILCPWKWLKKRTIYRIIYLE